MRREARPRIEEGAASFDSRAQLKAVTFVSVERWGHFGTRTFRQLFACLFLCPIIWNGPPREKGSLQKPPEEWDHLGVKMAPDCHVTFDWSARSAAPKSTCTITVLQQEQ